MCTTFMMNYFEVGVPKQLKKHLGFSEPSIDQTWAWLAERHRPLINVLEMTAEAIIGAPRWTEGIPSVHWRWVSVCRVDKESELLYGKATEEVLSELRYAKDIWLFGKMTNEALREPRWTEATLQSTEGEPQFAESPGLKTVKGKTLMISDHQIMAGS